jgi:hypothetical protein
MPLCIVWSNAYLQGILASASDRPMMLQFGARRGA